jgi:hypothetical protein
MGDKQIRWKEIRRKKMDVTEKDVGMPSDFICLMIGPTTMSQ